ncbi:MAG: flagellar basal body rod protein FlgC [Rhodobacteraceae bacterium]|nr:flagellar basal body rod protein FlgC [Paracoccaceae bacterium]
MSDLSDALAVSASGMAAQAARIRHVSENVANADTPGYHRKTVAFEGLAPAEGAGPGVQGVRVGPVRLDRSPLARIFDPGHPMADATGYYDGSNVDLVVEIADAREASRGYEANLKLFDQTRQMQQGLIELIRR